jgi:hypothetical protein
VLQLTRTISSVLKFTIYVQGEGVQTAKGLHWIMFLGSGWGSPVVCGIHLLGLQIYSCSFESSQQEEMVVH